MLTLTASFGNSTSALRHTGSCVANGPSCTWGKVFQFADRSGLGWLSRISVEGREGLRRRTPHAIDVLQKHANDPSLRDVIFRALVRQPPWVTQQCWRTTCSQMLQAFPKDGTMRQLTSDLLAEKLASLPRGEFLAACEHLRKERASETEPEVRIALGLATINAQLARVRTTPVGSQLFE